MLLRPGGGRRVNTHGLVLQVSIANVIRHATVPAGFLICAYPAYGRGNLDGAELDGADFTGAEGWEFVFNASPDFGSR